MLFKRKKKAQIEKAQILSAPLPQHIAIILDGNGRWAKNEVSLEQQVIKRGQ